MTTSCCTCHAARRATPRGGSSRTTLSTVPGNSPGSGCLPTAAGRLPSAVASYAPFGRFELGAVEEPVQDPNAERKAVDRNALVDAVEHAGEVELRRELQRAEPEAADAELAEPLRVGPGREAVGDGDPVRVFGGQRGGHGVPEVAVGGGLERDVVVDEFAGDLFSEQFVDLREELVLAAGQESPVEVRARCLRNHIHLVSGVQAGRVRGVLRGGADHLAHAA